MAQGRRDDCRSDPYSRKSNIYLNVYFHFFVLVSGQSVALSSAAPHTMLSEFDRKWSDLTLGSSVCPAVCGIQREADFIIVK